MRYWLYSLLACCALLPLAGTRAEDYPSVEILPAFVELHTSPGERYPVHNVAEHGEHVLVIKRQTRWYKVRTSTGAQGWVSDTQLRSSLTAAGLASLPMPPADSLS
jgi:SH3-like domain-containing protein